MYFEYVNNRKQFYYDEMEFEICQLIAIEY